MKKFLTVLGLGAALMMSACTSETAFGDCVGFDDDKDPALKYEISTRNVVLGIIFIETIIVPVVVALDEVECPIGKKAVAEVKTVTAEQNFGVSRPE